ncbi:hypothetical protein ACERII_19360 [Evansella sp. AB-rgal1]|uniref:hypothetical protein n=1 Tax=Evansella sp. AB-rgal1 TaxID=3242696 RepID=UPI00359DF5C4
MKRFMKYLIWTITIGLVMYIGYHVQSDLRQTAISTGRLTASLLIFSTLFPIFIGMLLRAPLLVKQMMEGKRWNINVPKLLAICLPALYISLSPLFYLIPFGHHFPFAFDLTVLSGISITAMTGMIVGYVLLDSVIE